MSEKKLYNIYHEYDVDGGFGDRIWQSELVATVEATEDEIKDFIEKWDKPEIYDKPYDELCCHTVGAQAVEIVKDLATVEPYSTDPDDEFNYGIRRMKERASK